MFFGKNKIEKKYFELDDDLYLIGRIEVEKDEEDNQLFSNNDFDRIFSLYQKHKIKTINPKLEE